MSNGPDFSSFVKLAEALRELEVTIGPQARPVIAAVRARLIEATSLRERGEAPAAIDSIRLAMEQLAALGSQLDPSEGLLMKVLADRLALALKTGDKGSVKESVTIMRHRAGDPKDGTGNDW